MSLLGIKGTQKVQLFAHTGRIRLRIHITVAVSWCLGVVTEYRLVLSSGAGGQEGRSRQRNQRDVNPRPEKRSYP
jgi:hypothetical protein